MAFESSFRSAPQSIDVSVVISTFNGCERLGSTLAAVLAQDTSHTRYEVIVVDNNSTDGTPDTIAAAARGGIPVTHLFESRQGVSYGRNAGIQVARAPIIAFTDDDVVVARDWISSIHRVMLDNPGVDYVTGKILPIFEREPPRWMSLVNSGPCVLRDRGNQPLYARPGCFFPGWATANIAFRHEVFDRVGRFSGDFPRGQDLEFIVRLWRAHRRGMYAPDVVVSHRIESARMTKAYHRMWHSREGDIRARLRFSEIFDRDDHVLREGAESRHFLGVPPFLMRQLAIEGAAWVRAAFRGDQAGRFTQEMRMCQTGSYLRSSFREHLTAWRRSYLASFPVRAHSSDAGRTADNTEVTPISSFRR